MTETPITYRRPSWRYETPSPRNGSTEHVDTSMDSMHSQSADLLGVLEQVSELTMEDAAFAAPAGLQTPVSLYARRNSNPPPLLHDEVPKRRSPSSSPEIRKKVRRGSVATESACCSPSKLFAAPPLPSSPDLSEGGDMKRIAPHFSPLGPSHSIDLTDILLRQRNGPSLQSSTSSPHRMPQAPPPTPQVTSSSANVPLPPPMPWFETPEQAPRRKVALALTMKRGQPCLF